MQGTWGCTTVLWETPAPSSSTLSTSWRTSLNVGGVFWAQLSPHHHQAAHEVVLQVGGGRKAEVRHVHGHVEAVISDQCRQ